MSRFSVRSRWKGVSGLIVILMALSVLVWVGCVDQQQSPIAPEESGAQEEVLLSIENPEVRAAIDVQDRHTEELLAIEDVVGTATGMTEDGRPAIVIMTRKELQTRAFNKAAPLPAKVEDIPVIELVTGEIRALKGKPPGGGGFDPTARHRPAPNGVSLGHPDITAGTLGCLVTKNNTTYILSNNHVMADENKANIGDDILQPGSYDGGGAGDEIATLSDFEPIVFNTSANNVIDAAIAAVDPADVTGATESGSYGAPRSATATASVNMRVMKYGRTTGETKGRVYAINATVNIGYDTGTARFINQIIISPGSFGMGGDSGSLVVVQKGGDARKPVGLYFAGSSQIGIANPIDDVLSAFGVTVVGD